MGSIAIVGVSLDEHGSLDPLVAEKLAQARAVVVPSPGMLADALVRSGLPARTYADLGLAADAPTDVIVDALLALSQDGDVTLAAGGYPFLPQGVVAGLLARSATAVDVFPVFSPLQVLMLALDIDLTADVDIIDAAALSGAERDRDAHLIVTGIENAAVARAVGQRLAASYALDHTVILAGWLEGGGFDLSLTTVGDFSRVARVSRRSAVYVAPTLIAPPGGFTELVRIVARLRAPDGCPWDREQTHASLGKNLIEESYEALAAIESGEDAELADELGDVLLQVVMHAQIGAEDGTFTIDDVIDNISAKLRRRHPHVFGDVQVKDADEVLRNWDAIKRTEVERTSAIDGVAPTLPALMYAQKLSRKAAGVGFEWEDIDGVWAKVYEEIDELKATSPKTPEAADELGDLLFTVVNLARKLGVDAEEALRGTSAKFERRFKHMETQAAGNGAAFCELEKHEMERLWENAKRREAAECGDE